MSSNRRNFLAAAIPAGLAFFAARAWPQHTPPQQPLPAQQSPNIGPRSRDDMDPAPPPLDPKRMLKANQEKIQEDVQRLFALATQLRDQVEKTDSTAVLSLALVQKAEEVEKLAHQIRTLAKAQ